MNADPEPTPRWVKVFGLIAILVIALLMAALVFGGGQHGPARHFSERPPAGLGR